MKIESEVQGKQEYEVHFIRNDDFIHSDAIHLMLIQNVIRTALDGDDDLIILATDSHRFTNQYNPNSFFSSIIEASNLGADILLGGALDFGNLIPLNSHLLWLDSFIGTSFNPCMIEVMTSSSDKPFSRCLLGAKRISA